MEKTLINNDQTSKSPEIDVLLKFLQKTKEGKYAEIEDFSLRYSRVNDEPETFNAEENYYYSIS